LTAYLTGHGIKTLHARTGQEAVAGVLADPVEVLVLDLGKPIIHALEVYLELKQHGHTVTTIIVTGYADEESGAVDMLRFTTVTGCLFKPFDTKLMLHAIKRISDRQVGLIHKSP
jgi:DNA-binding response OmpR family regulator